MPKPSADFTVLAKCVEQAGHNVWKAILQALESQGDDLTDDQPEQERKQVKALCDPWCEAFNVNLIRAYQSGRVAQEDIGISTSQANNKAVAAIITWLDYDKARKAWCDLEKDPLEALDSKIQTCRVRDKYHGGLTDDDNKEGKGLLQKQADYAKYAIDQEHAQKDKLKNDLLDCYAPLVKAEVTALLEQQQQEAAATKIQAHVRGFIVRKLQQAENAAVTIQTDVRGYLTMKGFQPQRRLPDVAPVATDQEGGCIVPAAGSTAMTPARVLDALADATTADLGFSAQSDASMSSSEEIAQRVASPQPPASHASVVFTWQTLNPFASDQGLAAGQAWARKAVRWVFWAALLVAVAVFPPVAAVLGGAVIWPAVVAFATLAMGLLIDTWRHYPYTSDDDDVSHLVLTGRGMVLTLLVVATAWMALPVALPAAIAALLAKVGIDLAASSVWLPVLLSCATALYHAVIGLFLYTPVLSFCNTPKGVKDTSAKRFGRAVVAVVFVLASLAPAAVFLVVAKAAAAAVASWQALASAFGGYQTHAVAAVGAAATVVSTVGLGTYVASTAPKTSKAEMLDTKEFHEAFDRKESLRAFKGSAEGALGIPLDLYREMPPEVKVNAIEFLKRIGSITVELVLTFDLDDYTVHCDLLSQALGIVSADRCQNICSTKEGYKLLKLFLEEDKLELMPPSEALTPQHKKQLESWLQFNHQSRSHDNDGSDQALVRYHCAIQNYVLEPLERIVKERSRDLGVPAPTIKCECRFQEPTQAPTQAPTKAPIEVVNTTTAPEGVVRQLTMTSRGTTGDALALQPQPDGDRGGDPRVSNIMHGAGTGGAAARENADTGSLLAHNSLYPHRRSNVDLADRQFQKRVTLGIPV